MQIRWFALILFLLVFSPLSLANIYTRGNHTCENFNAMESLYKREPENIASKTGYAECLILKGEDERGLYMLNHILDQDPNQVYVAYILAIYIKTGGEFTGLDKEKLDEAISAYQRVLFLIDLSPSYPNNGNEISESVYQTELQSNYMASLLYLKRFQFGFAGTVNKYLASSPSYEGDKSELNFYPKYSPHTMDSLHKLKRQALMCVSLPEKWYFKNEEYKMTTAACRILKEMAEALLPLEEKRLTYLSKESCHKDLPKCSEYDKVADELVRVFRQRNSEINEILKGDKI